MKMRGAKAAICCRFFHLNKFFKRKATFILLVGAFLFFLVRWKFICVYMQPMMHVQNLCLAYSTGLALGNLCGELCNPQGITSLSCHSFYQEKEAVFSGGWGNSSIVFKTAKKPSDVEPLYWFDISKRKIYPSEEDFADMIKLMVKQKFNIAISNTDANRIACVPFSSKWPNRHTEMENVWSLIQDNEYLALLLYENFDIFPKLVGTCGSLYGVQSLNTVSGYWHLMTLYDSQEEWLKRIRVSLKILEFLAQLESALPEPLLICNVKMNHFGITDDFKKIMYLDLDSVHPVSVVNRITGDGMKCKRHSDCDYLSCRSFCNLISLRCDHGVANNNLQIVCEKIFLGWVMSGRMMVPGLLMGPRTPHVLVEVLESCANPASESGTPRSPATKDVRKRLYDLLVHLTY